MHNFVAKCCCHQLQGVLLLSVFPESTASWEESGEDTFPATDHSGMKQQPEVLLCEGSHHITPLDVLLCEGSHHITPLDVLLCEGSHHITPLDVLLCGKSHHITPLPLTTVNKKCISGSTTVMRVSVNVSPCHT
ncbi:uncharacterized protein LOC135105425 isoform X1 [Scylla paramamosain]|uniref:uncharacterized protein LOC135105425 isoform X1 n=1 Tax=Scylla paramamosain TaxID=85552 RepID=UPI0030838793